MNKDAIKVVAGLLAVFLSLIFIVGCSSDDKKQETLPQIEGWKTYSYKNYVFHYGPDSFFSDKMDEFADAYQRFLTENCAFLGIPVPDEIIHFYIHAGPAEAERLVGKRTPFHTENQIHWGGVTAYGLELMYYLIDKMDIRRTDFDFLYDGLAYLRDYSNTDYHKRTASLIELKQFRPLDSLVNNESYARMTEPQKYNEAASFVGFITYNYGINRFKLLWQSTSSFDKAVEEIFRTDLDSFEQEWIDFVKERFEGVARDTMKAGEGNQ